MEARQPQWRGLLPYWLVATALGGLMTNVGNTFVYGTNWSTGFATVTILIAPLLTWPALLIRFTLGQQASLWAAVAVGGGFGALLFPLIHGLIEPIGGRPDGTTRAWAFAVQSAAGSLAGCVWWMLEKGYLQSGDA